MLQTTRNYLTSGDIRKYIKQEGVYCPYCGSAKIEADDRGGMDGGVYVLPIKCKDCHKRWYESYKLCDIQEEYEEDEEEMKDEG